ncbi:MAG TPA: hypothetical protein VKR58_03625 [Aquella sp.]|nr:hypothetical protein [Aquella sp.]
MLEDTVAKDCSYTNIAHSKDATGVVGTKCFPYPPCEAPTKNDILSVLFGPEKDGGHVFELEYKDDKSLPDRHIEVLNFENQPGTVQSLSVSDSIERGFITRKVRDEVVIDPNTTHYDYMLYRVCKNGQEKSPPCKVSVSYINGHFSSTVCGDQRS